MTTTKMNLDPDKADALAHQMVENCLKEERPNLLTHYAATLSAAATLAALAVSISVPESRDLNVGICLRMMQDMHDKIRDVLAEGDPFAPAPTEPVH
jgi:hypothetical protein